MKRGSDDNVICNPKTPKMLCRQKTSSSSSLNSDPVHVYCRLRPLAEDPDTTCLKLVSDTTLTLTTETKKERRDCTYVFKHIFTSYSSQREVFEHGALPLLEDLINGKNGLLFTYGVTGSGKTFTLTGDQNNPGIMPRCIDTLFNTIGDYQTHKYIIKSDKLNGFEVQSENDAIEEQFLQLRSTKRTPAKTPKPTEIRQFYINDGARIKNFCTDSRYAVFISYVEIYNNTIYDLLDESSTKSLQSKVVRVDSNKNMYVNNVVEVEVKSAVEAFELFYLGQKRKRVAQTVLNAESSRSHSIFNIRVVQVEETSLNKPSMQEPAMIKIGQLSLVDLAGSERTNRTQNTGIRLKEASSINNSLMSLRACLEILRENQMTGSNKLVPYRDSRLTLLFKNYFDGEGQVRMIVCLNPSLNDLEENLQVMKFAEMSQDVKITKAEAKYTPYAKTPKTTKLANKTPRTLKVKKKLPFTFNEKFVRVLIDKNDMEETIVQLQNGVKAMINRRQKAESYKKEQSERENNFRRRLLQIQDENILSKNEISSLKALFTKERQANNNLETKIASLEATQFDLLTKNEELQENVQSLHNIIDEKNLKINQNALERAKSKQRLEVQNAKMNHELEEKLRKQREHLKLHMQKNEVKIQKAKEILECQGDFIVCTENVIESPVCVSPKAPTQASSQVTEVQTPQRRANPPPKPNRHRRSRSAGEVYLEHNAVKPVSLGTVLQPSMKKRKSVTKLEKAKDVTNPNQNRYCLIAQEACKEGGIETKLYKGDILSTCGGGAQVIFSDVERLRQESPTGSPLVNDFK